ncbi:MAG: hypothetical protein OXC81_03745 [Betaproteobacteria bacterium]|nr:hypothetical protein [Betaproteobacteria bacterium]
MSRRIRTNHSAGMVAAIVRIGESIMQSVLTIVCFLVLHAISIMIVALSVDGSIFWVIGGIMVLNRFKLLFEKS